MPARMFSVEGIMGLRSWRYVDGTASLRAAVAVNSSTADGVASALKPRRTRIDPYPAAATARANRISEATFQGFMSTSFCPEPGRLTTTWNSANDERITATHRYRYPVRHSDVNATPVLTASVLRTSTENQIAALERRLSRPPGQTASPESAHKNNFLTFLQRRQTRHAVDVPTSAEGLDKQHARVHTPALDIDLVTLVR
jgi:hypothetical protein